MSLDFGGRVLGFQVCQKEEEEAENETVSFTYSTDVFEPTPGDSEGQRNLSIGLQRVGHSLANEQQLTRHTTTVQLPNLPNHEFLHL